MARKARGRDLLEQAKGYLSKAKTAEELRQAQAFVMPLEFGLIDGTNCSCDWCINWLGLPVAQSIHKRRRHSPEEQAITRRTTPGEHEC